MTHLLDRARRGRVSALRDTGCPEGFYAPPPGAGPVPPVTREVVERLMARGPREG
ncbi:hypothetical protein ILP92_07770 [Maribius pontilimi]|uniref:Uncharacterized protein n=1 Tax=Palleronia pontilimi TaxID=1964209 RepID=A0A934IFS7_9RHOB|nr:hypothetical protein [Palleronia pontilimi]MBJ3762640.1 hypothetical protein [Palleronia pontilimi]